MTSFLYDLSVIIPVFNTELRYFRRCLDSLTWLMGLSFEVIVVDDGSDAGYLDGLRRMLDSYKFELKLINKENGGQNSARELGLAWSRGRYVFFLDSDDYVDSTLLREAVSHAFELDAQILVFNYEVVSADGRTLELKAKWSDGCHEVSRREAMLTLGTLWSCLFSASFLRDLNFGFVQGTVIGEDFASVVGFASRANRLFSYGESIYKYVVRPSSITNSPSREACISILKSFDQLRTNIGTCDRDTFSILEYLAVFHILFVEGTRVVRFYGADPSIKAAFFGWLNDNYPNWRDNELYKNKVCEYGLRFRLMANGNWWAYWLLWKVKTLLR